MGDLSGADDALSGQQHTLLGAHRATGFVYAGIVFALKAGLMGGALTSLVLAA
jgi:hypothetical protein